MGRRERSSLGANRLKSMIQRIQTFDKPKQDAIRAKYGKRIDAANERVGAIAGRCVIELR